jgi:hypothetical protein
MTLPKWYIECAEDYLSILRSSKDYTHTELLEATKNQRLAEYKLMRERMASECAAECMDSNPVPPVAPVAQPMRVNLQKYDESVMLRGHFQGDRPKPNTKGFWENILK